MRRMLAVAGGIGMRRMEGVRQLARSTSLSSVRIEEKIMLTIAHDVLIITFHLTIFITFTTQFVNNN